MLFRTPKQSFELLTKWSNFVFVNLVSYGIHLGHSVYSSLRFCAWMIKGQRKGIFLIDLFKFVYMFRAGFFALEIAIRGRNPVWFINLDKTSSLFVKFPALECGEFWVVENWIRGMISNYFIIKKSLSKTTNRPFPAWNSKNFIKNSSFSHWGLTRHSWPRLIFVSNVMRSYGPCHEAHRLKIPSLGIVDTNTAHSLVAIAIPGNDEAATALVFYNSLVSTFILYMKYSFIHNWYMGCLNEKRFSFGKWWQTYPKKIDLMLRPNVLNFHFDQLRYMISGFEAQFLQDIWQTRPFEALRYLGNTNFVAAPAAIISFYRSRAKFFKSLKATWTLSALGLAFLRPRVRRWFYRADIMRQAKHSPIREKNLEMLLRLPRWKRRFFFRIARRLRRSRQPRRSYQFFYKFFGLGCLFTFFRSNFFFSRRFLRGVQLNRWWRRSHVRFPWFKHSLSNRKYMPRTYGSVYLRPRSRFNWRNNYNNRGSTAVSKSRFGFGQTRFTHQFPKEWSKDWWLIRYISSLGVRSSRMFGFASTFKANRGQYFAYRFKAMPAQSANYSKTPLAKHLSTVAKVQNKVFFFKSFFTAGLPLAPFYNFSFALRRALFGNRLFSWADQRIKYLLSLDHFDFFSSSNLNFHFKGKLVKKSVNSLRFSKKSPIVKKYFIFKYA